MKHFFLFIFALFIFATSFGQNVGINVANPANELHVDSTIKVGKNESLENINRKNLVKFGNGNYVTIGEEVGDDRLYLRYGTLLLSKSQGANGEGRIGIETDAPSTGLDINADMRYRPGAAAGKVLTSDAMGNATWQSPDHVPVAFHAFLVNTISAANSETFLTAFQENFETGGDNFNAATGIFTAPSDGIYSFTINTEFNGMLTGTNYFVMSRIYLETNTLTGTIAQSSQNVSGLTNYTTTQQNNVIYNLLAGDKIKVSVLHSGNNVHVQGGGGSGTTVFFGAKIN